MKIILSGNSNLALSEDIANHLNIPLCNRICGKFSNTEIRVKITDDNIRNKDIYIIQTGTYAYDNSYSVSDYLMEALIMIDACRRSMVNKVTMIMPCFPYARQDKKEESREPITAKLVANLLTTAGIDRLVVMDLHAPQIQGFFDIPVDNIYSIKLVIQYLEDKLFNGFTKEYRQNNYIVVAPDASATKRTLKFAKVMHLMMVCMDKYRDYRKANCVEKVILLGDKSMIKGKIAIILDDMCDTGGTLITAANNLVNVNEAKEVIAVVTHGILSGPALDRINNCKSLSRVIVSNSIPQDYNLKHCNKLEVFDISKMISNVIEKIEDGSSLSSLFKL